MQSAVAGAIEKQIDTLSEKNVVVGACGIGSCRSAFENIHVDLVAGKRSKRQGRHELRSSLRHDNGNVETAILEPAENLRCLVAGNAAADSEGDLHGFTELFFLANYFLADFLLFGDVGNPEFHKLLLKFLTSQLRGLMTGFLDHRSAAALNLACAKCGKDNESILAVDIVWNLNQAVPPKDAMICSIRSCCRQGRA